jgi:hypothetical protein
MVFKQLLIEFEKELKKIALTTIQENQDNFAVGMLALNAMGNFRQRLENKLLGMKAELGRSEREISDGIEEIYTKVYEELFETP